MLLLKRFAAFAPLGAIATLSHPATAKTLSADAGLELAAVGVSEQSADVDPDTDPAIPAQNPTEIPMKPRLLSRARDFLSRARSEPERGEERTCSFTVPDMEGRQHVVNVQVNKKGKVSVKDIRAELPPDTALYSMAIGEDPLQDEMIFNEADLLTEEGAEAPKITLFAMSAEAVSGDTKEEMLGRKEEAERKAEAERIQRERREMLNRRVHEGKQRLESISCLALFGGMVYGIVVGVQELERPSCEAPNGLECSGHGRCVEHPTGWEGQRVTELLGWTEDACLCNVKRGGKFCETVAPLCNETCAYSPVIWALWPHKDVTQEKNQFPGTCNIATGECIPVEKNPYASSARRLRAVRPVPYSSEGFELSVGPTADGVDTELEGSAVPSSVPSPSRLRKAGSN